MSYDYLDHPPQLRPRADLEPQSAEPERCQHKHPYLNSDCPQCAEKQIEDTSSVRRSSPAPSGEAQLIKAGNDLSNTVTRLLMGWQDRIVHEKAMDMQDAWDAALKQYEETNPSS